MAAADSIKSCAPVAFVVLVVRRIRGLLKYGCRDQGVSRSMSKQLNGNPIHCVAYASTGGLADGVAQQPRLSHISRDACL